MHRLVEHKRRVRSTSPEGLTFFIGVDAMIFILWVIMQFHFQQQESQFVMPTLAHMPTETPAAIVTPEPTPRPSPIVVYPPSSFF